VVAPVYGAVVASKNRRFDKGVGVKRVPVPVVSVGNLTVGGTGKTPFVMWLCRELLSRGLKPAIAMRGYKSEKNQGRSDEAEEYRAAMPEVPVIVNPDRHEGITAFLAAGNTPDVVVLDDGFQHRRLHRDLDVVLVDAQAGTPSDRLLPAGDLREPVGGIARAGIVVLTHAEKADAAERTERALRPYLAPGTVVARAAHRWLDLAVNDAGAETAWRVPWLRGKHVVAVCGIARPSGFLRTLNETGCKVQEVFELRDHQPVEAALAERVARTAAEKKAQIIVTTQKDFARAGGVPQAWSGLTVVRPLLTLGVQPCDAVLARVVSAIGTGRSATVPG
jgi:tetraacyldisaccharide 4'-kinase